MIMIKEQYRADYRGYGILVIGHTAGYRCGYVGIPEYHPFFGVYYNTIDRVTSYNLNVHGGLTYSGEDVHDKDPDFDWWIGFDCSHIGDAKDPMLVGSQMFMDSYQRIVPPGIRQQIWTMDMVIAECKRLIDELHYYVDWVMPEGEEN